MLKHFAPFVPDSARPFDARLAAHLLRRAGFGASSEQIQGALENGLNATVDGLFVDTAAEDAEMQQLFTQVSGRLMNFGDIDQCQAWWINWMCHTQAPLREKLTLFWHGHFATHHEKVENNSLMLRQIDTLRMHAWGKFHELVGAMAKDPAMLIWLDGQSSTKAHPNENFARELMELFTCGIGNYTERDVQEAARAFTGWHREGAEFKFNSEEHDAGPKQFLGKAGKFDGGDIIDILMSHPPTATFIARKLLRFFAEPEPANEVVAEAADLLIRSQFSIKWFLRDLFQSQYFFSPVCYRQRIASPVEFVVGTIRTLKVRQTAQELANNLEMMGQSLFAPPNVKGWDGEKKWINSSTLAARAAFAEDITQQADEGEGALGANCPINDLVPPEMKVPAEVVQKLVTLLFQGELPQESQRAMAAFLVKDEEGSQPRKFAEDDDFRNAKIRKLLSVLLGLPEFQSC